MNTIFPRVCILVQYAIDIACSFQFETNKQIYRIETKHNILINCTDYIHPLIRHYKDATLNYLEEECWTSAGGITRQTKRCTGIFLPCQSHSVCWPLLAHIRPTWLQIDIRDSKLWTFSARQEMYQLS